MVAPPAAALGAAAAAASASASAAPLLESVAAGLELAKALEGDTSNTGVA